MTNLVRRCVVLSLAGVVCACATASLDSRGAKVVPLAAPPGPECKNLGMVIGQGGGAAGNWVSNDKLMEYALNDAMNKAGERGATHFQASGPPALGGSGGTTTTATVSGVAYQCPVGSVVSPSAPSTTPQSSSPAAK